MKLLKYPRTTHVEGSRLQHGDHDLEQVRWCELADSYLVIEEKVDGANAAISFGKDGSLLLQSRGHYLTGGHRERHFAMFKTWAARHRDRLWAVLGDRLVMYGEWTYAKHTIFYDRLPHYFLEFDLLDRQTGMFLSTKARRALLGDSPVVSVPVIWQGKGRELKRPERLVGRSHFKTRRWVESLTQSAAKQEQDVLRILDETDSSPLMEGLYIKRETENHTIGRHKWIRRSFLDSVQQSGSHWLTRPIVPNQLAPGVDIYA